jgi:hypothetical protein
MFSWGFGFAKNGGQLPIRVGYNSTLLFKSFDCAGAARHRAPRLRNKNLMSRGRLRSLFLGTACSVFPRLQAVFLFGESAQFDNYSHSSTTSLPRSWRQWRWTFASA